MSESPDVHRLVTEAAGHIVEKYVFADIGLKIRDHVLGRLGAGAYDGATTEEQLSGLVSPDLQSINGDKHLRLAWREYVIESEADEEAWLAQYAQQAADSAYGVAVPARLPGDIAILDLTPQLFQPSIAGDAQVAAMQAVADAGALIIDVRGCRGGSPAAVALMCTYLIGTDVHLTDFETRDRADLQQIWTMPWVPGPTFGSDKPVAVLTSAKSFSGAEDLAYTLQANGRATVIGETTGGGAHPRDAFKLSDHLEVTVPVARSINVKTKANWEGIGVIPDLAVPAGEALDRAAEFLSPSSSR